MPSLTDAATPAILGDAVVVTLAFDDGSPAKSFELQQGGKEVIRIGREKKCDVVHDSSGVSWNHCILKLLPSANGGAPQLCVRDLSTNGTGLAAPGTAMAEKLVKDMDTPIQDGSQVLFPMKLKDKAETRKMFTAYLGLSDALPTPAPAAQVWPVAAPGPAAEAASPWLADEAPALPDAMDIARPKARPKARDAPAARPKAGPKSAPPPAHGGADQGERGAQGGDASRAKAPAIASRPKVRGTAPGGELPPWKRLRADHGGGDAGPVSPPAPPAPPGEGQPSATRAKAGRRPPLPMPVPGAGAKARMPRQQPAPIAEPDPAPAADTREPEQDGAEDRSKLGKARALIRSGREAEEEGRYQEAYDCYREGLRKAINALAMLPKDTPQTAEAESMVSEYLERAEKVKNMV